jgi:hypothetical protein
MQKNKQKDTIKYNTPPHRGTRATRTSRSLGRGEQKMKYQTKNEAMQHLSDRPMVAAKQTKMINSMYSVDMLVSQDDIDGIALDCHQDAMAEAMSY